MSDITPQKGISVIPNDKELEYAQRLGWPRVFPSELAVHGRNVSTEELATTFERAGVTERQELDALAREFPDHQFVYHVNVKKGTIFSPTHLKTLDAAQDTESTQTFVAYQASADVTAKEFESRLSNVAERFSKKTILPVLDPATQDLFTLRKKCAYVGQQGYRTAIVLYRNPLECFAGWQTIQAMLQQYRIEMLCLNMPRRWTDVVLAGGELRRISTLCIPLLFGCRGVAHAKPWSGSASPHVFLSSDLDYRPVQSAGAGTVRYTQQNLNRQQVYQQLSARYEFTRVDAILEAHTQLTKLTVLQNRPLLVSACSRIEGISHAAKKFGLL